MSWSLDEAISYYRQQGAPGDQSALISLLKEIQSQSGGSIPPQALNTVVQSLPVKESLLHALIRRIPSLRLGDKHSLTLCAGPNCRKSAQLAASAEQLCKIHGNRVSLQYVPCMRMCAKGPNIKWDGVIHHQATPELLKELLK